MAGMATRFVIALESKISYQYLDSKSSYLVRFRSLVPTRQTMSLWAEDLNLRKGTSDIINGSTGLANNTLRFLAPSKYYRIIESVLQDHLSCVCTRPIKLL